MRKQPKGVVGAVALAVAAFTAAIALPVSTVGATTHGVRPQVVLARNPSTHLFLGAMPIASTTRVRGASAPAGAQLTYYGGPVLSNIESVQVKWGSGSYQPFIGTYTASFINQYLGSGVSDWLSEYNTPSSGGTGQSIGRGGTSGSLITITPSVTSSTIQDTQVQTELINQIHAGFLPIPNANTSYAIYFPHGKTICQGGSCSGVAGGFCAYHSTFTVDGVVATYQIMPDNQAGSGDATGCGNGTAQANETSVLSHELIETITDPQVGFATTTAPPVAWYDSTNGEIGDICNASQGSFTGTDGVTYVSQKMFSNTANDCVTTRSTAPSITSSASATFALNSSNTFTATATGLPFPTFSEVGALPSGVGLDTNGTLSGTPTQSGIFPITLTAHNGSGPDSNQSFTLTVQQAPAITSAATATFVKGIKGTFHAASTGTPSAQFSTVGTVPNGVSISGTGVLSGIAQSSGTFKFNIVASNGVAPDASQPFTLKVVNILITTRTLGTATRGKTYSLQLTHLGGVAGFSWSITSPKLPHGLSLSRAGKITGTVSHSVAPGTYSVGITVHDSAKPTHQKATSALTIVVK